MRRTNWFERKFATIDDNGLLPGILERLDGTTPRLRALIAGRKPAVTPDAWSAAKELGHLVDLEPLWRQRISEIAAGHADMGSPGVRTSTVVKVSGRCNAGRK